MAGNGDFFQEQKEARITFVDDISPDQISSTFQRENMELGFQQLPTLPHQQELDLLSYHRGEHSLVPNPLQQNSESINQVRGQLSSPLSNGMNEVAPNVSGSSSSDLAATHFLYSDQKNWGHS